MTVYLARNPRCFFWALTFLLFIVATIHAQTPEPKEPAWFQAGAGVGGVLNRNHDRNLLSSVEYRLSQNWVGLHPYLTVDFAFDGAWYFGTGLLYNFDLSPHLRLTLSTGPGYYDRNRRGTDLGYSIEFLSNAELTYALRNHHRLGISIKNLNENFLWSM